MVNAAPQEAVKKTLQLYSEKDTPIFFEAEKWDLPLKKLKEFATKHNYTVQPEYRDLDSKLAPQYPVSDDESKKLVIDYALDALPVDLVEDLVPFLDFFRICFLKEDMSQYTFII
jgi:hypothetical protein